MSDDNSQESNKDFLAKLILEAQRHGGLAKMARDAGVDPNVTLDELLTPEDLDPDRTVKPAKPRDASQSFRYTCPDIVRLDNDGFTFALFFADDLDRELAAALRADLQGGPFQLDLEPQGFRVKLRKARPPIHTWYDRAHRKLTVAVEEGRWYFNFDLGGGEQPAATPDW